MLSSRGNPTLEHVSFKSSLSAERKSVCLAKQRPRGSEVRRESGPFKGHPWCRLMIPVNHRDIVREKADVP